MNSDLTHAVTATSKDAQYDASAKRLLGQKSILAHILEKKCIKVSKRSSNLVIYM